MRFLKSSNPFVSAERDLGSKRELSPFFIKAKSPVCRAICAIIKLISEVRNAPFFLSYTKPDGNIKFCNPSLSAIPPSCHSWRRFRQRITASFIISFRFEMEIPQVVISFRILSNSLVYFTLKRS